MHVQATVRGDLESVVSWWTSPERREERRVRHESLDVSDFRYEETLEDGQRVTETGWTTRRGVQVSVRTVSPIRPHGTVERDPDGRAALGTQIVQSSRWPNGPVHQYRAESVAEFSELSGSRTRVRLTVTRSQEHVPWRERSFPPHDERHQIRIHLKDYIARCEYDLEPGSRQSAGWRCTDDLAAW